MSLHKSRRDIVAAGAKLIAGAALSLPPRLVDAQTGTVRVTHFGGPYTVLKDLVGEPFHQNGLGTVEYDVETSVSAVTKLQAAQSSAPFDVLMVARSIAMRGAASGLFGDLDFTAIPRSKEVIKDAIMPGNKGIAFVFDSVGIMYRDGLEHPIQSWKDLLRPDLKGRVSLPAANLSLVLYVLAGLVRAIGSNESDEKAIDEVFGMLRGFKNSVRVFFTDPVQANQLIERGDVTVAPQFGLRIANLAKVNSQVVRATLKERAPAFPYDLCIAKSSQNITLANKYIDFVISKPIQDSLSKNLLATPVRRDVDIPEQLRKYSLSDTDLFFADETYIGTKEREWLDRWRRDIQS